MGNPFTFNTEDFSNNIAEWGPGRAIYLVPPATGPGVSLKQLTIDCPIDPTRLAWNPVLSAGVKLGTSVPDLSGFLGPFSPFPMHSGAMTPATQVYFGPLISHFNPYILTLQATPDMNASRILLDFTRVGNFRAEPGHYMAIQFMPGISGEGDGQNNLWLFDGFRGQFYLDE